MKPPNRSKTGCKKLIPDVTGTEMLLPEVTNIHSDNNNVPNDAGYESDDTMIYETNKADTSSGSIDSGKSRKPVHKPKKVRKTSAPVACENTLPPKASTEDKTYMCSSTV